MNSYSQYGEDKIVAEILHKEIGFREPYEAGEAGIPYNLLDIGAWEPRNLSNTRAFIELGFTAVLCEFSPEPVRQLVKEYADCPRVQVVAAAVTPIHQHCLEFRVSDDALSAPPDSETVRKWGRDNVGGYYGRLFVPTVPLKDIVNQFFGTERKIDYCSIDTEGTSVDLLLELWSLNRKPRAIVCEHDGRDTVIWEAAKLAGYTIRDRNETNVILEHRGG